MTAQRIFC